MIFVGFLLLQRSAIRWRIYRSLF